MSNEKTNHFDLMLQAMTELVPEIQAASRQINPDHKPPLASILDSIMPLPPEALFVGMAEDDLPVLLNLNDSTPGPILIAGDSNTGKSNFLRIIARSVNRSHSRNQVQFGVVTHKPEYWAHIAHQDNCAGVFSTNDSSSDEFILGLSAWAHENRESGLTVLLLWDGLENILKKDIETRQAFRWLLFRGPTRKVWPFVSLDTHQHQRVHQWVSIFRTRLFGQIANIRAAEELAETPARDLLRLNAGSQFAYREDERWLRFWIPD